MRVRGCGSLWFGWEFNGLFLALVDIRTVAVCFTIAGTEGLEDTL